MLLFVIKRGYPNAINYKELRRRKEEGDEKKKAKKRKKGKKKDAREKKIKYTKKV